MVVLSKSRSLLCSTIRKALVVPQCWSVVCWQVGVRFEAVTSLLIHILCFLNLVGLFFLIPSALFLLPSLTAQTSCAMCILLSLLLSLFITASSLTSMAVVLSNPSDHFPSSCCCSLKIQMESCSCIWKGLQKLALPPLHFFFKTSTSRCINYTLGGIIHGMVENVHLSCQIYPMHKAHLQ